MVEMFTPVYITFFSQNKPLHIWQTFYDTWWILEALVSDIQGQMTYTLLSLSEQAVLLTGRICLFSFLSSTAAVVPSVSEIYCLSFFFQRLVVSTSWQRLLSDGHIVLIAGAIWLSTSTMAILEPCLPIWLMDNIKPRVNIHLHLKQVFAITKQKRRLNK